MIDHSLFPTLISEFHYDFPQAFKDKFFAQAMNYMSEEGFSNESTGHVALHLEPSWKELFEFVSTGVEHYMFRLGADPKVFDINFVKTFLAITKEQPTPLHNHADAHITWTYYVNIPDNVNYPIRFHNIAGDRHIPYPGFCVYNNARNWFDHYNSDSWRFVPTEGQLFVFSGNLWHDTQIPPENLRVNQGCTHLQELKKKRICMAGDIVLTYKDKTAVSIGLQPVKNWRTF
jgi:hypothetical protein